VGVSIFGILLLHSLNVANNFAVVRGQIVFISVDEGSIHVIVFLLLTGTV
jgi:hypothetical protein